MAEVEAFDSFTVDVARETWDTFRREPVLFLIAGAAMVLGSLFTLFLLSGPLYIGYIELVRKVRQGEPVAVSTVFSRFDSFIPSAVLGAVVGITGMIGLVLLVLPGLLVFFCASWSANAIAYDRMGGVESLRESVRLVRAFPMHTFALLFGISVLHVLGNMLVVGGLIALPLATIAMAIGYERLRAASPAATVLGAAA